MNIPSKTLERKLLKAGYRQVIGVDEVGMGCLAGPVVVCAVSMSKDFYTKNHNQLRGLRESKLLSAKQRETFARELIKEKYLTYCISLCYPKTIDKLNIYQATRRAMKRAVLGLVNPKSEYRNPKVIVLIDGKHKINGLNLDQRAIVKGDREVFIIACASIIAKVYRDRLMVKMAKRYPGYGFEVHKGYGTKYHQEKLAKLGVCAIHRQSFAPVAKLVTMKVDN